MREREREKMREIFYYEKLSYTIWEAEKSKDVQSAGGRTRRTDGRGRRRPISQHEDK